MPNKLEVEGKEILIKSSNGTMAVIPKDKVSMVKGYIDSGNHGAVDKFVSTLKEFKHENQKAGDGLYANIHAKRARIAAGSGERMRKVGEAGAPTASQFKQAAKTAKAEDGMVIKPAMLEAFKRIQEEKARKPIVVTNPNDPRLKAYQDSLALYNKGETDYTNKKRELIKNIDAYNKSQSVLTGMSNLFSGESYKSKYKEKTVPMLLREKYSSNINWPFQKTYMGDDSRSSFRIEGVYDPLKHGEKSNLDLFDVLSRYKKPEQPVVLGRPLPKLPPKINKPVIDKAAPKPPRNNGNTRPDGTKKGKGFLGEIKRPDGKVSTELSIGVNIDGKEVLIPTMVPGLTKEEITHLTSGKYNPQARKGIDDVISRKAIEFAKERAAKKQPFFATPEEEGKFKLETTPDPEPIAPRMPSTEIIDTSQPIATPEPVTVTQPAQPVLKEVIEAEKPVIRKGPKAIMPRRQGGWSNQPLLMRMFPKLYAK
jgi:hypothetical protein